MGKSSSQANTTTTTTYNTNASTNIGLSGNDVHNIINDFAQFALADEKLNHGTLVNTGVSPQSADPSGDVHASGLSTQTIVLVSAGIILVLLLFR